MAQTETTNPGFSPDQINSLSAKLDAGHVKTREQGKSKVSYIEGWHAIAEANRIFGFDAWDRETLDTRMVTERETVIGRGTKWEKPGFAVAYTARVRITVRAGAAIVTRDGCGYGSGIDADIGSAHESAIKEAETDAMKRAMMTFGNPFGLALYDKTKENVEHGDGAANTNASTARDPKAIVAEMIAALNNAPTRADLDAAWDAMRADMKVIPKADQEKVGGIFDINAARVLKAEIAACPNPGALAALWTVAQGYMGPMTEDLRKQIIAAKDARKSALAAGHQHAAE